MLPAFSQAHYLLLFSPTRSLLAAFLSLHHLLAAFLPRHVLLSAFLSSITSCPSHRYIRSSSRQASEEPSEESSRATSPASITLSSLGAVPESPWASPPASGTTSPSLSRLQLPGLLRRSQSDALPTGASLPQMLPVAVHRTASDPRLSLFEPRPEMVGVDSPSEAAATISGESSTATKAAASERMPPAPAPALATTTEAMPSRGDASVYVSRLKGGGTWDGSAASSERAALDEEVEEELAEVEEAAEAEEEVRLRGYRIRVKEERLINMNAPGAHRVNE